MQFKDLKVYSTFNTMIARYLKMSDTTAIVLESGLLEVGSSQIIKDECEVILIRTSESRPIHYIDSVTSIDFDTCVWNT